MSDLARRVEESVIRIAFACCASTVARRADRATTKHVPTAAEVRAILEACEA